MKKVRLVVNCEVAERRDANCLFSGLFCWHVDVADAAAVAMQHTAHCIPRERERRASHRFSEQGKAPRLCGLRLEGRRGHLIENRAVHAVRRP